MKRISRGQRAGLGAALGVGAAVAAVPAAQAADYTVTNLADSGPGSLRAAIDATNVDPVGDRILFQSGLTGAITLENDLTPLDGPVEIVGPGMDQMKIDGGQSHSLLETGSYLKVSGLTLANGYTDGSGGGISASGGDLLIDKSRIEGGQASGFGGGISLSFGNLTLSDSEVSGNTSESRGGGLAALYTANVAITRSTFSGNAGDLGGGAYIPLAGDTEIKDSVFENNNSGGNAGGLFATGAGISVDSTLFSGNQAVDKVGGAYLGAGALVPGIYSVTNSTFTGNVALEGGALLATGGTKIQSSTITGNTSGGGPGNLRGAGLIAAGPVKLDNSIVSGNEPGDIVGIPASIFAPEGRATGSFNLIGKIFGDSFTEFVPGSNITSTAPQLDFLADNGGPTKTMLPAASSPVVNKGSSPLTVDQRGLIRPVDFNSIPFSTADGANGADIGAVELQGGPLPPSSDFTFGKVKLNKKKGVATLQVKVPGAGKAQVIGSKTVAASSKTAKAKATISLTVKAKGKAAKTLKKKGKVKVKASVKFTPTGGTAKNKSKTVKLIKAKKKK